MRHASKQEVCAAVTDTEAETLHCVAQAQSAYTIGIRLLFLSPFPRGPIEKTDLATAATYKDLLQTAVLAAPTCAPV